MLQLSTSIFKSFAASVSSAWQQMSVSQVSPHPERGQVRNLKGNVAVVFFDFDGTLTATPGDRAERKFKIAELKLRAPLLEPWLERIRAAGIMIGIVSKSSENTIVTALEEAGLRSLVNGPVIARAVGLEYKAGIIRDVLEEVQGPLEHIGASGLHHILLVDDDLQECACAKDQGIQTFPAPFEGGLLDEDFHQIFEGLGLPAPPRVESSEILRLWTWGKVGEQLGCNKDPTTVEYSAGSGPLLTDFYRVEEDKTCSGVTAGAFGVVKCAVHVKSGLQCALKHIHKESVGKHYIDTFIEEDMYTFLLKSSRDEPHPNVVAQLDYLLGQKMIWNPQEWLEGPDLFSYLHEFAPITQGAAKSIMKMVLSALSHIHQISDVGLIHRDVKLENLRFRSHDRLPYSDLVLVDFGLCCAATPERRRGIMGTKLYMAPEIYTHYYTSKVDMWSAGVLLYIVLTGQPPWTEDRSEGLTPPKAIMRDTAIALESEVIRAAPQHAVRMLKSMLTIDPNGRPTADDALHSDWFMRVMSSKSLEHRGHDDQHATLLDVQGSTYNMTWIKSLHSPKAKLDLVIDEIDNRGSSTSPGQQPHAAGSFLQGCSGLGIFTDCREKSCCEPADIDQKPEQPAIVNAFAEEGIIPRYAGYLSSSGGLLSASQHQQSIS